MIHDGGYLDDLLHEQTGLAWNDGKATGKRHCYELIQGHGDKFDLWIDQTAWKLLTLDEVVEAIRDREAHA